MTSYFTKIAVFLAVFGVLCFDSVSVGVAKMNLADTATEAAQMGAESWNQDHNRTLAFKAAADFASEHGADIQTKTFRIDADGTVWVTLDKDATTLVLYRIGATKKWVHSTATGHGRAV